MTHYGIMIKAGWPGTEDRWLFTGGRIFETTSKEVAEAQLAVERKAWPPDRELVVMPFNEEPQTAKGDRES